MKKEKICKYLNFSKLVDCKREGFLKKESSKTQNFGAIKNLTLKKSPFLIKEVIKALKETQSFEELICVNLLYFIRIFGITKFYQFLLPKNSFYLA
ncbi:MAG: hypothetical protein QXN34_06715 [Archaeoglobaceae archaeon]